MRILRVLPTLGLCLLAAVQYLWISPQLLRLSADYAEESSFNARSQYRESPTEAWINSSLTARRVDTTLIASASHSIIEGDMHWSNDAGEVQYENTGIYGVDRYTRMNLPEYGDTVRSGPFLFPPHIQRKTFSYWDPVYLGSRVATFERLDIIGGLKVYVFLFKATAIDETAGYSQLRDVPERYHVHSDGIGHLWVEPTSGALVDFEDQGVSYFVENKTGKRIGDVYKWSSRYSLETKKFKIKQALMERRHILALELWLPIGLLLSGLFWYVAGLKLMSSSARPIKYKMQPEISEGKL